MRSINFDMLFYNKEVTVTFNVAQIYCMVCNRKSFWDTDSTIMLKIKMLSNGPLSYSKGPLHDE